MKVVYIGNFRVIFSNKVISEQPTAGFSEQLKLINEIVSLIFAGNIPRDYELGSHDSEKLFHEFSSHFEWVEAAGGVVCNNRGDFLFIQRFGIWDLPKGKVESGETFEEAALREVSEETGIDQLTIVSALPDSFHIYKEKQRFIIKHTSWYLMDSLSNVPLTPQVNEQITRAVWLSRNEGHSAIGASYRSLNETLGYLFTQ